MARRPSVLFINRVYPPARGATGRVLRDLARSFARDGWDVTVLTTGAEAGQEKDGPIRVIRVKAPLKGKTILGYLRVWRKLLAAGMKQDAPDLLVTMTDPPMTVVAGSKIAKKKKCRHIHWCQDLYPELLPTLGINLPDFMMDRLQRMAHTAMGRCDRIVAIGRCMARQLTQAGLDPKKITVIPNWPDFELMPGFKPPANVNGHNPLKQGPKKGRMKNGFRRANGQKAGGNGHARPFEELFRDGDHPKFRVLYSGTLGRAHPISTVLEAAEILNRQAPDVEFVFVGDGPGQEKLAQERARRGLENIRLLPFQPAHRLKELMESGDVHLISMRHEAAGLLVPSKLYSALAVERPCILVGPVHCETAKVIKDFKAGTVVPQGEPEILAQAIANFMASSENWFSAHQGASQAGRIFVPDESISAWLKRARDTVGVDTARTGT